MADSPHAGLPASTRVPLDSPYRAEAIAQLVRGTAHDLDNLLTAVLVNLTLARSAPAHLPAALLAAEQAAFRAADLTRRLTTLARRRDAASALFDHGSREEPSPLDARPGRTEDGERGTGVGLDRSVPRIPHAPPCILFVDDHDVVRRIGADLLRTLGARVRPYPSAHEAEAALVEDTAIDLLLLDATLQGESSGAVAARFRGLRPDLPILVAAPCPPGLGRRLARNLGADGFVSKPFRREELRAVVFETLTGTDWIQPAAVITS